MSVQIITREGLEKDFYKRLESKDKIYVSPDQIVNVVDSQYGISGYKNPTVSMLDQARALGNPRGLMLTGNYRSGFDVPFGDRGSINDRAAAVRFGSASANTLDDSWSDLFDVQRIDLTMRKTAKPTIREFIYSEVPMPNAPPTIKPQEMFPWAFEFKEIDGQGQAVPQGVKMGGQYDSIDFTIYATGFSYTLLLSLFDRTFDIQRMNDGVAAAYAMKRDDLAISPILDYDYGVAGTAKHTDADATADAERQELLYLTLTNAIDDLGKRKEASKGEVDEYIVADDLICLCSTYDANHIAPLVSGGLPSVNERRYPSIRGISQIITYDTKTIAFPDKTVTYTGVTSGTIYLIKKNNRMIIPVKRGLTMELDAQPNVKTLAKEERAWYFCESIFNAGIADYIQKVTLPSW